MCTHILYSIFPLEYLKLWVGAVAYRGFQTSTPATPTGFEPVASCVTGRRDNRLRYGALVCQAGLEPAVLGLKVRCFTTKLLAHINHKDLFA